MRALLLFLVLVGCASRPAVTADVPVILISVDGMRPDYLGRGDSTVIDGWVARGVRAGMRPRFPTLTFPNHYTIVTGKRPDHHGIVDNTMFDPTIPGVRFSLGNRAAVTDRRWWDDAEPVWVTAEKAGLPTATMFWPGTETDVQGVRPTRWRDFDGKMPANDRVDVVLGWLDDPAFKRPRFMTLYFDDVDHAGHVAGPESDEVRVAMRVVDAALARLEAGLKARGVAADIVLVSDHGMAALSEQRILRMSSILKEGSYRLVTGGTSVGIDAAPGWEAEVAAALAVKRPHVECWPKAEIPARFGLGTHRRVPQFFCLSAVGWLLVPDQYEAKGLGGAHGYDHEAPEMLATFVAVGPGFREGVTLPDFDNVHVYPLLMRRLGLKPLASDGDAGVLAPALRAGVSHGERVAGGAGER